MVERKDEMLCEMCEKRPAVKALPRSVGNAGHLWVCDECNPYRGQDEGRKP